MFLINENVHTITLTFGKQLKQNNSTSISMDNKRLIVCTPDKVVDYRYIMLGPRFEYKLTASPTLYFKECDLKLESLTSDKPNRVQC